MGGDGTGDMGGDGTGDMGGDGTGDTGGDGTGDTGGDGTGDMGGDGSLSTLKEQVEQARAGAREALDTIEDLNAQQVTIEEAEKAKIEAYVAKADEFLQAYESAEEAEKTAFDDANNGYVAEIQQSRDWNANDFLPRTEGGTPSGDDSSTDNSTDTSNLARSISGSVGKGGDNKEEDVRTVQGWLNSHGAGLEVTGQSDNKLVNEIKKFQRRLGQTRPDGRVDPGKNTWKGLLGEIPAGPPATAVSSIIQGGESGAAGYNAYNRGTVGNTMIGADKPLKLVEMTLAEIRRMQELPGGHADKLFAVGKYQMIPTTLKEGISALSLETSRLYNAETQEYLFSDYLMKKKRPALHEYITGGGDERSAGIAGAQEWASIACPPGTIGANGYDVSGRSYYDGIGGNGAHISHEDFIAALNEARQDYQKYLGQGMSSDEAYRAAVSGVEKDANSGGSGDGTGDNTGDNTGDGGTDNTGDNTGDGGTDNTGDGGTGQSISGSVGRGGDNKEADVKLVQELLNAKGGKLDVDGKIGNKTIGSIESFQKSLGMSPDGLVEPGKNTWKGLNGSEGSVDPNVVATGGSAGSSFDPGEPLPAGSKPGTSNFKLSELCVSATYPHLVEEPPQNMWPTMQKLMNNLEVIRAATGGAITINSGYRAPALNSAVGGVSNSQHLYARAADIVSSKMGSYQLFDLIIRLMDEGKITPGGVGRYSGFVHYDIRGTKAPFYKS